MDQIRSLCKNTRAELYDQMIQAAEAAQDAGTEEEEQEALDLVDAIIYTLKNCAYEGRNPDE